MPIQQVQGKPLKKNIAGAMFDIQPIDESGSFDSQRFENISKVINLKISDIQPEQSIYPVKSSKTSVEKLFEIPVAQEDQNAVRDKIYSTKQNLLGELEDIFSSPLNVHTELSRVGGQIHDLDLRKTTRKIYQRPSGSEEVLRHGSAYVRPNVELGSEVLKSLPRIELVASKTQIPVYKYENILNQFYDYKQKKILHPSFVPKSKFLENRNRLTAVLILTPIIIASTVFYLSNTETNVKNNVVQNGKNAVANMMDAKQSMEELRFSDAVNSFKLAHDDFVKANNTLDKLGASFAWFLKYIPGINKITSANNMVIAGQNIAKMGEDLSSVLNDTSRIKLNNILTPGAGPSLHDLFKNFYAVAESSRDRIEKTKGLLANINAEVLPEDKRDLFNLFKDRLPQLSGMLDNSIGYSKALLNMIPERGSKKYLILFQNNSELRATGGFPGSYAVISFNDGRYGGIKIDDVYNPDGQLKNNIIPPKPLQHITQTWGMRDANWFADFPTSARKVMEFYHDGSGDSVDGVLTMTPDIITNILKITGPIDMPEYGVVLSADNFVSQVQEEVEYNQHKPGDTPKKILIDFFPRFLARLSTGDQKSLFMIAKIFSDAIENKHILAYFNDPDAEKIALENNFSGIINTTASDYLQVVFSNVKGSKTDTVTDSLFKLSTKINNDNSVEHSLTITRKHNGGDFSLRFYNLQNPDYVRVYVPENAKLESVNGNDVPNFKPLVDYNNGLYKKDHDLQKIESDTNHLQNGVDVLHESGRKVYGFWMILDPQQTKTVTIKYKIADAYNKGNYHILIEKQAGTGAIPLEASFELPTGKEITGFSPNLQIDGNSLILKSDLNRDKELEIKLR